MAIDTKHFKTLLQAKEQELLEEMTRLDENARDSRSADVEDPIDAVISAEAKAGNFEISTKASDTLAQVQSALQRIDRGEYGFCEDCGREIPAKRLEAVPWALYCVDDQERRDRELSQTLDEALS